MLAARRARTAVLLLEQNVIPGRATAWLARRADLVCVSFDETAARLPRGTTCRVTGNPLRGEIAALVDEPRSHQGQPSLLVLGGSQGAASLNGLVVEFVEQHGEALRGWSILHQTGAADYDSVAARYGAVDVNAAAAPFLTDMAAAYRRADLVVSRAGATTLAELACAGLPALLLPHRHAVRNHQAHNAAVFAQQRAAVTCLETGDTVRDAAAFAQSLLPLLAEADRRAAMTNAIRRLAQPFAAQSVCDALAAVTLAPR